MASVHMTRMLSRDDRHYKDVEGVEGMEGVVGVVIEDV